MIVGDVFTEEINNLPDCFFVRSFFLCNECGSQCDPSVPPKYHSS